MIKMLFPRDEAITWCRGRNWLVRLPVLSWFGYVLVESVKDPMYRSVLAPLSLGIHEMGHLVFSFFGTFMNILGGTLLECLAPIFLYLHFYRQKEFFGMALCFGWLSTVLFGVATYVGDAQAMQLPLVTVFGAEPTVSHDWNYLLGRIGLLHYDFAVAFLFRCLAMASMLVCLWTGAWLLWRMFSGREENGPLNI